jgi:hypothetical protein
MLAQPRAFGNNSTKKATPISLRLFDTSVIFRRGRLLLVLIPHAQVEGGGYNQGYYNSGLFKQRRRGLETYEALRKYEDCACGSNTCDDLVEWIISLSLKASALRSNPSLGRI